LSVLGLETSSALNGQQSAALSSELQFLCSFIGDPVLRQHASALSVCAERVARATGSQQLLFERS
jgi:hypothetical protein